MTILLTVLMDMMSRIVQVRTSQINLAIVVATFFYDTCIIFLWALRHMRLRLFVFWYKHLGV